MYDRNVIGGYSYNVWIETMLPMGHINYSFLMYQTMFYPERSTKDNNNLDNNFISVV